MKERSKENRRKMLSGREKRKFLKRANQHVFTFSEQSKLLWRKEMKKQETLELNERERKEGFEVRKFPDLSRRYARKPLLVDKVMRVISPSNVVVRDENLWGRKIYRHWRFGKLFFKDRMEIKPRWYFVGEAEDKPEIAIEKARERAQYTGPDFLEMDPSCYL